MPIVGILYRTVAILHYYYTTEATVRYRRVQDIFCGCMQFTFHSTVHHLYSLSNSTILGQKAPVSVVGRGSDHGMQILINDVWDSFTQPIMVVVVVY